MSALLASLLVAQTVSIVPIPGERPHKAYRPKNPIEAAGVEAAVASIEKLGEGRTVQLVLEAAPHLMNVSADEGASVREALGARYAELAENEAWSKLPSPLASAFRKQSPSMIVASPAVPSKNAPVVLFLHGYGGSGKLFAYMLSRAMPEAWIVAPSHGLTWARPRRGYARRALAAFEKHTGVRAKRVHLVGLSDGAVGAFEVYRESPRRYHEIVSIVGVPRADTIGRLPSRTRVVMLNGRRDRFVGAKVVRRRYQALRRKVSSAHLKWFEGGHYFLLNEDGAALGLVRRAVGLPPA